MTGHRRHSIITRASIFLLLGAIVNVAVAWAIAAFIPFLEQDHPGWSIKDPLGAKFIQRAGATRVVFTIRTWSHLPEGEPYEWRSEHAPCWMQWPSNLPSDLEAASGSWFALQDGFGWPIHALSCTWQVSTQPNYSSALQFGIRLQQHPEAFFVTERERGLPFLPLWPGFAINTLFYAAILWLLFFTPGTLRRRRRIKRGLCPACAYPIGVSPVCTECGNPVNSLPLEGEG